MHEGRRGLPDLIDANIVAGSLSRRERQVRAQLVQEICQASSRCHSFVAGCGCTCRRWQPGSRLDNSPGRLDAVTRIMRFWWTTSLGETISTKLFVPDIVSPEERARPKRERPSSSFARRPLRGKRTRGSMPFADQSRVGRFCADATVEDEDVHCIRALERHGSGAQ